MAKSVAPRERTSATTTTISMQCDHAIDAPSVRWVAGAGLHRSTPRRGGPIYFRVPEVLSISSSGHKFGQSCCGTGWVVWREREGLAEHVAISVSYLGGSSDSFTLNFSRPATGVYVQFYKFLRLGTTGYRRVCDNAPTCAEINDATFARRRGGEFVDVHTDDGRGRPHPQGSEGAEAVGRHALRPTSGRRRHEVPAGGRPRCHVSASARWRDALLSRRSRRA